MEAGRCCPFSYLDPGGSLPWACVKGEGVGWGEGMTSLPLFLEMNPWKILKWCSRLWSHWDTAGLRLETGCGNMQSRQDQTDFLTHFCGKASPSEKPAPRAEGELSCGSRADTGPLHRNGGLCLGRGRARHGLWVSQAMRERLSPNFFLPTVPRHLPHRKLGRQPASWVQVSSIHQLV